MKMLVLGAGLQGTACAFDLLETTDATVTIADRDPGQLPAFLRRHMGERLIVTKLAAKDEQAVLALMREHDAALCALPYYLNVPMTRLAVEAGVHFADLGGNTEIVRQQESLDQQAKANGVSVIPDCGLAPGMVNVLAAEGIRRLDRVDAAKLYVGGLPQHPEPPLYYQVVYSLEGALDYYTTPSWVLRNGKPTQVEALSEIEDVVFQEPLGTLEAFHTGGGVSTMPWELEGVVQTLEYKTLRFRGHATIMRAIRDLGLLGLDPVNVRDTSVRPRDLFVAVVDSKLRRPESADLVALKVVVRGTKDGRLGSVTFQLLDYHDREHGISAMMRTTGYSLSITGQMQVDGRVTQLGVRPAYRATPFEEFVAELRKRGVGITEVQEVEGDGQSSPSTSKRCAL